MCVVFSCSSQLWSILHIGQHGVSAWRYCTHHREFEFVGVPAGGVPVDPGASLVCRTEHVNAQCCTGSDGGKCGRVV
jgi:hypothetical protein